MEGYLEDKANNRPGTSLLYLLILVFAGAFIFTLLGIGIGIALYGTSILQLNNHFENLNSNELNFISISQICSALGTFVVPALLFNRLTKHDQPYFNSSLPEKGYLFWLTILIMVVATPFFEWTVYLNEQLKLPDFLEGIENWMKLKEEETGNLTQVLLSRNSVSGLLINLFMIGVLAAVGEELLFRGCLQNILAKWMGVPLAIWLTAIVFSAIHLQFYGFLPRMLIGALCGYLYHWGKSIWLPITAHFFNNASAILISFTLIRLGKPINYFEDTFYHWSIYVLSFLTGLCLLFYFKRKSGG